MLKDQEKKTQLLTRKVFHNCQRRLLTVSRPPALKLLCAWSPSMGPESPSPRVPESPSPRVPESPSIIFSGLRCDMLESLSVVADGFQRPWFGRTCLLAYLTYLLWVQNSYKQALQHIIQLSRNDRKLYSTNSAQIPGVVCLSRP